MFVGENALKSTPWLLKNPSDNKVIGKVLIKYNGNESVFSSDNYIAISSDAFNGNNYIQEVIIGRNTKHIGTRAFANCEKLTSVVITISGFLASAFAAESFAGELANMINISFITKETLTTILIILITLILSYFTLVFGELLPKKIGLANSYDLSFKMVKPLCIVISIFNPVIRIIIEMGDECGKSQKIQL